MIALGRNALVRHNVTEGPTGIAVSVVVLGIRANVTGVGRSTVVIGTQAVCYFVSERIISRRTTVHTDREKIVD